MPNTNIVNRSINLTLELYAKVDEYRFKARFKSESEAIRHLLDLGLKAEAERLIQVEQGDQA